MRPVVLIVLDGWGLRKERTRNAIAQANTPIMDSLWKEESHTILKASGKHVGLAKGYMGNSEVGHLHIGAGRLVLQDMMRIFRSIEDRSFFNNKVLLKAMKAKRVHLLGLLSDAGVHSHIDHLFALLDLAKKQKVKDLTVHVITDGRDTPPRSAVKYLKKLEKKMTALNPSWTIGTLGGRYFFMDRDKRWPRTHKAYDCMVVGKGKRASSAQEAIKRSYANKKGDEFIEPTIIGDYRPIEDGDSLIFYNFRTDRTRQLSHAFTDKRFTHFRRERVKIDFVCMTEYDPSIAAPVAFPPQVLDNTLGEVISKEKIKQYRIAETEKYNHVTFFFNGLSAKQFPGEERANIPSPKVATYDTVPKMSALNVKDLTLKVMEGQKHDFILVNFANADMVGHTGFFGKTKQAIKTVDDCIGQIVEKAKQKDFLVVITADHGNAEDMSGKWETSHTLNDVPFIVVGKKVKLHHGHLYDVAPTILKLAGIKKPKEMTGKALF